jgi:HEAT repeat protein
MFKDGLRALRVLEGFEAEDLERFLVVLHKAKHLRTEEDDLITLLWSADFSRVFYSYIDLGDVEEPQLEPAENDSTSFSRALAVGSLNVETGNDAKQDEATTSGYEGSADPPALPEDKHEETQDVQVLLSANEIDYLRQELARERQRDVVSDVVNALLDRLEDSEPRTQSEVLLILSDLIPSLVLQRRLELAASTLRALRGLAETPAMADESRQAELQQALDSVGSSSAIEGVLQALEAGDLVTDDDVLREVLASLGPDSFDLVIRTREKASRNGLRVTLDIALEQAAKRFPDQFVTLCHSQDPIVACGAIRIVGQSGRELVETSLVALLTHKDAKIRTAIVEAMVLHGGELLLRHLVGALHDSSREVRCAAAWGLGTWQYMAAFEDLQSIVESKAFREVSVNEMRAMFSAYARIGQKKALPTLGRILNKKSFFGGRESTEMRVCAARALGALNNAEALEQLERAQNDKDPAVRRAALRSLMAGRKTT